ncbi:L,D-transpeptidase family protein [Allorhizobium borbori]|uniref:Peptidoglycan hydrolase-like protein with peptidoglycan-binding domain n=1 Tax=Allorhizobium borbori TaxID=485907 RepID=A0A7W6P0I2_9HYPH|nr:L,D-transpeptidase family protein [Allorhizobium borbori]MBB4102817.1 peptidoglycan hydrolase-like protein with peptidoglycan-binding domain [Allorhizobium borbori]
MVSRLVFCLALLPGVAFSSLALAGDDSILQIVVSKAQQSLAVYRDGTEIATTRVSTGKAGHSTPTGVFSILEKRKYHESNIYSNAPMPFMQRLTWSGIALHEGRVPNYPASHGCIRLPAKFARELFGMTARGVHVVISEAPVVPVHISHNNLFIPRQAQPDILLLTDTPLRSTRPQAGERAVEVAMNETTTLPQTTVAAPREQEEPIRILITRRGDRERILDMQTLLNQLGFDAGIPDGHAGQATLRAIAEFRLAHDLPAGKTVLDPAFLQALYSAAGKADFPNGQLFVRQNFKPLFEGPVSIRDPEKELGTHFFIATEADAQTGSADWTAMTLENRLPEATLKRLGITQRADTTDLDAAGHTLDRIDIPDDLRERIERRLGKGSSITITDNGISPETGQGTDFITLTKPDAAGRKS